MWKFIGGFPHTESEGVSRDAHMGCTRIAGRGLTCCTIALTLLAKPFFFFFFKVNLFGRQSRETDRWCRRRAFSSSGSLLKCLYPLGLGPGPGGNPVLPHGQQEPDYLNHYCCLPGSANIGRKMEFRRWSQECNPGIPVWNVDILTARASTHSPTLFFLIMWSEIWVGRKTLGRSFLVLPAFSYLYMSLL